VIQIDSQDAANRLAALMRLPREERHAAAIFLGLDAGIVDLLPVLPEDELPTLPRHVLHDAALLGRWVLDEAIIQGHLAAFRSRDAQDKGNT
jgi:hypothetical protein